MILTVPETALRSDISYMIDVRDGVQGLVEMDYRCDPNKGEFRAFVPSNVLVDYEGAMTGGAGTDNIEHGTATVTLPNGVAYRGEYRSGRNSFVSELEAVGGKESS